MTKKKVGLALFWLGVVWAFFWGILASIHQVEFYASILTFEELNETIWATSGPLMALWGFAPPLGALVAGIGSLLYSDVKTATVWKAGVGVFLAVVASLAVGSLGHFPPLFAIGGTLILSFFFGILWLWAKERADLGGQSATAADLKLVGYVFMVIAAWYTCGIAGPQWLTAFADRPPLIEPITVMIFFVLGWLFLFLSHLQSHKQGA
ncbi:MAG: hypothetical protein JSW71_21815 [Gemmatimonadota bacterium]|nr:MAG: hypothetical protein JSW71_21815 [Gemmatimonadota bacterium]